MTSEMLGYAAALRPYRRPLEKDEMLREAQAVTGLADWGGQRWDEEGFRTRFSALCRSLEHEARLSERGRDRAHSRLHTMLCSRLRYIAWRSGRPDVDAQTVVAPLVGTGLPRTGTTFLHNLLAQDPANMSATAADCAMPVPTPADFDSAERTAIYQHIMAFQGFTEAEVTAIHPYAASLTEECAYLQELACPGMLYGAFFNVPSFAAVSYPAVPDDYRWQREQMKALQADRPTQRWALKGSPHILFWEELVTTFPDAQIYINHRDPGKVIPSIASLYMKVRSLFSDVGSDPREIGPALLGAWSAGLDKVAKWRRNHPEANIVDIHYLDLIANPMATVERLYDTFGLTLGSTAVVRMRQFLQVDHHAKAPKRAYGLADYGLDEEDIETAFGAYIDDYRITRERRT